MCHTRLLLILTVTALFPERVRAELSEEALNSLDDDLPELSGEDCDPEIGGYGPLYCEDAPEHQQLSASDKDRIAIEIDIETENSEQPKIEDECTSSDKECSKESVKTKTRGLKKVAKRVIKLGKSAKDLWKVVHHHTKSSISLLSTYAVFAVVLLVLAQGRETLIRKCRRVIKNIGAPAPHPNEVRTRAWGSFLALSIGVTVEFCLDPATVLNIVVGVTQAWATFNWAEPIGFKKVNLIVLATNFLIAFFKELTIYRQTVAYDEKINGMNVEMENGESKRAEDLQIDSSVRLKASKDCQPVVPALLKIRECVPRACLLNTKPETGEDCAEAFKVDSTLKPGLCLNLPGSSLMGRVLATRQEAPDDGASADRFPHFVDGALAFTNLVALVFLAALGFFAAAVSFEKLLQENTMTGTSWSMLARATLVWEKQYNSNTVLKATRTFQFFDKELWSNFWSTMLILNGLLPAMRFPLLYLLFVQVSAGLFSKVFGGIVIQNYSMVPLLARLRVLFTDKTGTQTEEGLVVNGCVQLQQKKREDLAKDLGISQEVLTAILLLACNDTQEIEGVIEGTSPEEITLVKAMRAKAKGDGPAACALQLLENPLELASGETAQLRFSLAGEEVSCEILERTPFIRANFCRLARLKCNGKTLIIRQGMSDRLASKCGQGDEEASLAVQDPNRALGYTIEAEPGQTEFLALRVTFSNPIRKTSPKLMQALTSGGCAVRIMTGDAEVAATFIAAEIGIGAGKTQVSFPESLEAVDKVEMAIKRAEAEAAPCLVVKGSMLISLFNDADRWAKRTEALLSKSEVDMVIYRAGPQEKEAITRQTCSVLQSTDGLCAMMGDAANDAPALAVKEALTICMKHGASPCRAAADVIVEQPGDVIEYRWRYGSLLLGGSVILAKDVTFTSSLMAGLAFNGVWNHDFKRLALGLLYEDVWSVASMSIFAMGFWPVSTLLLIYAQKHESTLESFVAAKLVLNMVGGLALGLFLGAVGPRSTPEIWGEWALACVWLVTLVSHFLCLLLRTTDNHMVKRAAISLQVFVVVAVSMTYNVALKKMWEPEDVGASS